MSAPCGQQLAVSQGSRAKKIEGPAMWCEGGSLRLRLCDGRGKSKGNRGSKSYESNQKFPFREELASRQRKAKSTTETQRHREELGEKPNPPQRTQRAQRRIGRKAKTTS